MTFKVGDKVKWTSSSSGSSKTKTGEVLVIIPASTRPYEAMYRFSPQWQTKYHNVSVPGYGILPRNHESYIVAVSAKTSKGKLKLYWPVVSFLEGVE
jgi:hypothetical protein